MDYATQLARLYKLAPRGIDLGLERVCRAHRALCSPGDGLWAVQIAGTNGKGTTACLLAHAASCAGLRVGLFTSPHLVRFSERIRLNGAEMAREQLAPHLARVLDLAEGGAPALTFFEVAFLTALLAFAEADVELAVLEVGLGGRLDATSIVAPQVQAITTIGLDHTDLLGETLEQIAAEKAAIARPGVPLVVGMLPGQALDVVRRIAKERGAPLRILGQDFAELPQAQVPWPGRAFCRNAAVALEVFRFLGQRDTRLRAEGFVAAAPRASWPGRMELLKVPPGYRLDGAHNAEAVAQLIATLGELGEQPGAIVFGAMRNKPLRAMLEALRALCSTIVLYAPPLERAFDPRELAAPGDRVARSIAHALTLAAELATPKKVLVCGSLLLVGEARAHLLGEPTDPLVGL